MVRHRLNHAARYLTRWTWLSINMSATSPTLYLFVLSESITVGILSRRANDLGNVILFTWFVVVVFVVVYGVVFIATITLSLVILWVPAFVCDMSALLWVSTTVEAVAGKVDLSVTGVSYTLFGLRLSWRLLRGTGMCWLALLLILLLLLLLLAWCELRILVLSKATLFTLIPLLLLLLELFVFVLFYCTLFYSPALRSEFYLASSFSFICCTYTVFVLLLLFSLIWWWLSPLLIVVSFILSEVFTGSLVYGPILPSRAVGVYFYMLLCTSNFTFSAWILTF